MNGRLHRSHLVAVYEELIEFVRDRANSLEHFRNIGGNQINILNSNQENLLFFSSNSPARCGILMLLNVIKSEVHNRLIALNIVRKRSSNEIRLAHYTRSYLPITVQCLPYLPRNISRLNEVYECVQCVLLSIRCYCCSISRFI